MKRLASNTILTYSKTNVTIIKNSITVTVPYTERVLWVDPDYFHCYVIDVYADGALPIYRRINDVIHDIENQVCVVANYDPFVFFRSDEEMHHSEIIYRDVAWNYIKDIVYQEPEIYQREKRGKLIQEVSLRLNVSFKTVSRHLRRFWQNGKNKNTLVPQLQKR